MYVAMNHIAAEPSVAAQLAGRFANRAREVDQMDGFQSFELLEPMPFSHGEQRGTEHLVVTRWDTAASFEAWLRGRQGHRGQTGESRAWLTTHAVFEAAYATGWQSMATAAAEPVAMMNVIDLAPGVESTFEEVFRTRERGVEAQPGFLSLEVLKPVDGPWDGPDSEKAPTYVVFSRWASEGEHTAWTRSEAFRSAHGRRRLPDHAVVRAGIRAFHIRLPAYAVSSSITEGRSA